MSTKRLPQARHIVIVHDGGRRWVGNKKEIYSWIAKRGFERGVDRNTGRPNSVSMDAEAYDDMCHDVTYRGHFDKLSHEDIDLLMDRGADALYLAD